MALSDKNIVITPNISSSSDPKIVFSGADASTGAQNITLQVYPTNSGTLSFEGSNGQLLSIANSMTGTIYSVNDISGVPSIEVLDSGIVKIAQYSGLVGVGTADFSYITTDNTSLGSGSNAGFTNNKLYVNGSIQLLGNTDSINFGRGTATFLKDEELGFGWGSGWYMQDGSYLRVRNNISVYSTGGARFAIMYDTDNTGYYCDPSSTSYMNVISTAGTISSGSGLGVSNTSSSTGIGLSLYNGGSGSQPTYGIMFAGTGSFSTHGSVTADWATYFTMDSTSNRGWIFRNVTAGNVASVNNSGTAVFNGNVTAYSDIRVKKNILIIENALNKVMQLRGVTYDRTDDENLPRQTGVIAQEVLKVLPEAVGGSEETTYNVAYGNMVGLLIEAIKEQQLQIEELKSELKALRG